MIKMAKYETKYYQDGVDTIHFCLVLEQAKVSHVTHDACKTLQSHLVQVGRLKTKQRILKEFDLKSSFCQICATFLNLHYSFDFILKYHIKI